MYSNNKLTHKQYDAIGGFIIGLAKLKINAYKEFDLSSFDESSYESTQITFGEAWDLVSDLYGLMHDVYNKRVFLH